MNATDLGEAYLKVTKRNKTQPETKLIKAIMELFRWNGHIVIRVYGGGRVNQAGRYIPQPYLEKGTADLIVCLKPSGIFLALEVKTLKGRVSEEQMTWLERVRECGGHAQVVRSVEEAEIIMKSLEKGETKWTM